jgi:hypothetical protein
MNKSIKGAVPSVLAIAALLGAAFDATAGGIPYAGNRPQSFQFSTEFKESYDSFGQYIQANDDSRAFNNAGQKVDGGGGQTYVGLSSRLHYFKFDALPDWGWIASVTVPEVRVQGKQLSASGIGDPLIGGLTWTNPTPTSTVGLQAYVQAPIGSSQVTSDTWSFWPSVFANAWLGNVNVDMVVGGILRGTTHKNGIADIEQGNTAHGNLRVGYSISPPSDPFAIPFVSVDFQKTGKTKGAAGTDIAGSDSRETALGLGVLFQLKPGSSNLWHSQKTYDQLSFHYSRGVNGKNTSVTNGLFAQYWHYW